MKNFPLIRELMSPFPYTISGLETVKHAKYVMYSRSVRHLPVMLEGELIGIITDRDIKLAQAVSSDSKFNDNCMVKAICLRRVYVVQGTTRADKVLLHMANERIGSALITEKGKLVGVFTVTDACRAFSESLRFGDEHE